MLLYQSSVQTEWQTSVLQNQLRKIYKPGYIYTCEFYVQNERKTRKYWCNHTCSYQFPIVTHYEHRETSILVTVFITYEKWLQKVFANLVDVPKFQRSQFLKGFLLLNPTLLLHFLPPMWQNCLAYLGACRSIVFSGIFKDSVGVMW